jgi:hypothetical protein
LIFCALLLHQTAAKGIGGSSTPDADASTADTAAAATDEDVELAAHEPAELQAELQEELQQEALAPAQENDMDVEVTETELLGIVPTLKLALNMLNAGGKCSSGSVNSVICILAAHADIGTGQTAVR